MHTRIKTKKDQRVRRHTRIRSKVRGTEERPRLSIFKSNRFLYAQIIDDNSGKTLLSSSTREMKGKSEGEKTVALGEAIAKSAQEKKIKKVVFDRGGFMYTGKIKSFAESARSNGLEF